MLLLSRLPRPWKVWLRAHYAEAEAWYVRLFRSYDANRLTTCLHSLGVCTGDTVMLHSAFGARYGFGGTIDDLTRTFLEAIGPSGNLLMVSLPYRSSSLDYLGALECFDVRKTPSMMGLVSEYFRRRAGVLRSLNPSHPVLACGSDAEAIVAGHEDCPYPCGPGTPFEKLAALDGKVIFFNVPFATFTFFHHIEHLVSPQMPFPLYTEQPLKVAVIDRNGSRRTVHTYAFSREAIRRRRFEVFEHELRRRGLIRGCRVGASRLEIVRLRDTVECARDMMRHGQYFHDFDEAPR